MIQAEVIIRGDLLRSSVSAPEAKSPNAVAVAIGRYCIFSRGCELRPPGKMYKGWVHALISLETMVECKDMKESQANDQTQNLLPLPPQNRGPRLRRSWFYHRSCPCRFTRFDRCQLCDWKIHNRQRLREDNGRYCCAPEYGDPKFQCCSWETRKGCGGTGRGRGGGV